MNITNATKKIFAYFSSSENKYYHPSLSQSGSSFHNAQSTASQVVKNIKRVLKRNGTNIAIGIVVLLIIFIVFFAFRRIIGSLENGGQSVLSGNQATIPQPDKELSLQKEFSFPLKDATGKEVSKIKVALLNAAQQRVIIVKGRQARALSNRTFLVINLKITNDYNKTIQINLRDYLRLTVNKSSEKLAPDIHNDPVEIQALSTKYTRVGFPINRSDKNIVLQVGEINRDKEMIPLKF